MENRLRLGELLVRAGLVAQTDLDAVLSAQSVDGRRLGSLLVSRGLLTETQVTQILSQQLSVPWVSLQHVAFSMALLSLVPRALARRYTLIPIYVRRVRGQSDLLYVAMDDPVNGEALAEVSHSAGLSVRPMIASPSDIRAAIRANYGAEPSDELTPESTPPSSVLPAVLLESAPPSSLDVEGYPRATGAVRAELRPTLSLTLPDGSRRELVFSAQTAPSERWLQAVANLMPASSGVDWEGFTASLIQLLEDSNLIRGWELHSDRQRRTGS